MENGKGYAWTAPTINIVCTEKSNFEGCKILGQKCKALRTDVSNLQRRVRNLEKTRVDHEANETAAVLCQIALNIEHEVKEMVVAHVGARNLTAIYSARTRSIDKYVLKNTMMTTLLDHAFNALGESDYYKMETRIFPSGVELFEDTMTLLP